MNLKADKNKLRQEQHLSIWEPVKELHKRPRLKVFNSLMHIYVQLIDEEKGVTIIEAKFDVRFLKTKAAIIACSKQVGAAIVKTALAAGITEVVFDRDGCIFNGFVQVLTEAVREGGLKF